MLRSTCRPPGSVLHCPSRPKSQSPCSRLIGLRCLQRSTESSQDNSSSAADDQRSLTSGLRAIAALAAMAAAAASRAPPCSATGGEWLPRRHWRQLDDPRYRSIEAYKPVKVRVSSVFALCTRMLPFGLQQADSKEMVPQAKRKSRMEQEEGAETTVRISPSCSMLPIPPDPSSEQCAPDMLQTWNSPVSESHSGFQAAQEAHQAVRQLMSRLKRHICRCSTWSRRRVAKPPPFSTVSRRH